MARHLPKTIRPRQGKRKRDTWGPCRACGVPTGIRCARCRSWRCGPPFCSALRKAPGRIGVYFINCTPKCLKRTPPDVAARVRGAAAEGC